MLHVCRLVYLDSPHAPPQLWEWEAHYIDMLVQNAQTFHREVEQCSFLDWDAMAQENQRIWDTHYLPHPLYEFWVTWQSWLAEYRELVRDMQDLYEEHNGRMR